MLDDIIRRMEKMMARLKTDDSSEEKPRGMKPRTYGMNLTEDSGYVWNDLTKPSIHYNVEASESTEETIPDDRSEEKDVKHEKEDKARILKEDVEEEKDDKQEPKEDYNVSNEEKGRKRHEHNDAEDVIDQLMGNVKEKVKKQVEKLFEELKKEIRKPKEDDRLEPFKDNDSKKTSKDDKEKKDVKTKDSDKTIDDVKEKEKHETKNVYGNTVGEKVTNIFIFYSNDDPDKVLKDVSKLKDSEDLNVDIKLNINKNKDEDPKKDESTQVPTEAKKDAIDLTTKAPEKDTSTTETPKDKEEKSTTITESTTTETTKRPDAETTKNERTTESSKVETTERPTKEGKDDPEDKNG
ncbi:nucleolin 2-like [Ostrinia furnacalis]|uniref:nucleolin 2-like n=1 Tax=Ostrinia furnacalis TaxID=93504 RepID=UPI00103E53C7|nr:nucleolin 2-like [Ostrinia furnacalis]